MDQFPAFSDEKGFKKFKANAPRSVPLLQLIVEERRTVSVLNRAQCHNMAAPILKDCETAEQVLKLL